MSTTSRLENSSRQLVGRLARKVESDSPVGIPGAPGRLVDYVYVCYFVYVCFNSLLVFLLVLAGSLGFISSQPKLFGTKRFFFREN
jgi:hypothetical protein